MSYARGETRLYSSVQLVYYYSTFHNTHHFESVQYKRCSVIMFCGLSGVHRDAEEAAVIVETAGAEVAPPLPTENHDGQRRVPERVRVLTVRLRLPAALPSSSRFTN